MIDIDGEVVAACRKYLPEMHQNVFDDPRLRVIIGDALEFLNTTTDTWDVIISDLTDPIESGPAFQLFTQEHYKQIRQVLSPKGLLSLQAGPITPPEMHLHTRLVKTLQTVFEQVHSCLCPASSYGAPLAFILAAQEPFPRQPEPAKIRYAIGGQNNW